MYAPIKENKEYTPNNTNAINNEKFLHGTVT
jgi:hypothetical protein